MKLIRMHVDNFGGLHDFDYKFTDGLNVVLHDNGWGKTTMATFLKAMLYGYDTKRSKDITENDRKRYLPWQGGKYGGSLDFEADGIQYRILRTFGETPRFDTAKIINLNNMTTARIPSDKIGETLFHLDANAFQRSVFINQNGLSIDGAASSIHTRLNALVSQANDVAAFDGAIAQLTQQVKVYEKTGARGLLGDISRQIAEKEAMRTKLDKEIAAQDAARERIVEIDRLLQSIGQQLQDKTAELETVTGESKKQEATQRMVDELNERIESLRQQLASIEAELCGVPMREEIEQARHNQQSLTALSSKLQTLDSERAQLEEEYIRLCGQYGGMMPGAAQLDQIQRLYGELQGLLSADAADIHEEAAPEEYTQIAAIAANTEDFVPQLQSVIKSSAHIQELYQQHAALERDLQKDTDEWNGKTKRYSELRNEVETLQSRLQQLTQYSPSEVNPGISALEDIEHQRLQLMQQEAETKAEMQREESSWSKKRAEYTDLKQQAVMLKAELDKQRGNSENETRGAIAQLEEHKQLRQKMDDIARTLEAGKLTTEEASLLQAYPAELPDAREGNDMLGKHRQMLRTGAEMAGLASRLEGEKSKKNSLSASLAQLNAVSGKAPEAVEQPRQSNSKALMGAGIALIIIGALLAVAVTPILGAVAALGVLLIVLGTANQRSFRAKKAAYERWLKDQEQYEAVQKQQKHIREQVAEVQRGIQSIEEQIASCERSVTEDQASVSAWLKIWGNPDAESVENEILHVLECTSRVTLLRAKQADRDELEATLRNLQEKIAAERAVIDAAHPSVANMTAENACESLRSAQTVYRITSDKLLTAQQQLKKFLTAGGVPESAYACEQAPSAPRLQQTLAKIAATTEEQRCIRDEWDHKYPEIAGCTIKDALNVLRSKLGMYQLAEGQLHTAEQNLKKFVAQAGVSFDTLQQPVSPRHATLASAVDTSAQELQRLTAENNAKLRFLDLDTDAARMPQALSEAAAILNVYLQHNAKKQSAESRKEKNQQQADTLRSQIDKQLAAIGVRAGGNDMLEVFASVRKDIAAAAQLQEKLSATAQETTAVHMAYEQAEMAVDQFVSAHGGNGKQVNEHLAEISQKTDAYAEMTAAKLRLEEQCASLNSKKSDVPASNANEAALRSVVESLKSKKDALLIEYTQKSEAIRLADRALDIYPDVTAEIRSLYEQKQQAQSKLATLKRTIQLITSAKENLATRYLSKVEQLFNSYMHIWMNNDAIRGVLDLDFNVSIEEDSKLHVAQGYSTGYCDMIDFCMRLALVDTLFDKEQPFLILDDPFANLDAARLDKALELLNAMAASKQVVYFVCHPIRAAETVDNAAIRTEFMQLAENAKKAVRERKKAAETHTLSARKSPREMYHVTESAASHALMPANTRYTITNNIFSMSFVPGETANAHDYCFELFFIDAAGRVLNDRQIIEIVDGQLSSERIQFNLNTRDDSGNEFELMIRESGHNDYEVAARYPFRAKLAFMGTFNFDF